MKGTLPFVRMKGSVPFIFASLRSNRFQRSPRVSLGSRALLQGHGSVHDDGRDADRILKGLLVRSGVAHRRWIKDNNVRGHRWREPPAVREVNAFWLLLK